jgi:iron complex outermembrane receptor protein
MIRFILIFIFNNLFVFLFSQSILTGTITDKDDGTVLAGANVLFPELSRGTISDVNGNYEIANLPQGDYIVTFSYVGYKTEIKKIKIDKTRKVVNVQLSPVVIEGQEVVISGNFTNSQHENTVKISTLKSITLLQASTPSFIEAITSVPGVEMISKGPGIATPVIRGLSTSNILFLNNGIPLQNFQFSENHPYIVDEAGLGNIEVLKGPASLLYGSGAVGGIINIIPEVPLPEGEIKGDVIFKYFSNTDGLAGNIDFRGTNKNIIWGVYGNVNSNKDYYDGNNNRIPNSRFNTNSIKADVGLIKKKGTFRLFGQYSHNNLGLTVPHSVNLVNDDKRKTNIWYQDLTDIFIHSQNKLFFKNFIAKINIAWQENRRKLHTDNEMPVFTTVDMLLKTFNYSVKLTSFEKKGFRISSGVQGYWQKNNNFDAPDHVLPNAIINEFSVFSVGQYNTGKLNVEAGLRYTFYDVAVPEQLKSSIGDDTVGPLFRDFNNVSFSTGMTYGVNDVFLFRANIASAFRAPNLAELTQDGIHGTRYEIGNPNLNTQRNYEFDAGFHFHTRHTTVDLSGFYNHIKKYIYLSPSLDTTSGGLPVYYYQQDLAYLFGGEAKVHIHPHPVHWLHLMADWEYTIGKKHNGEYLPFIPPQKFGLEVKAEKERWHFFEKTYIKAGLDVTLAQNKTSPFETATDDYTLLNASFGTTLLIGFQKIILNINGSNLTNKTYQNYMSTLRPLNNMGRNISVVIKIPLFVK